MRGRNLATVLIYLATAAGHVASSVTPHNDESAAGAARRSTHAIEPLHGVEYECLQTSLCEDMACSAECELYQTPLNKCYNGQDMFPGDPSWGEHDVLDTYSCHGIGDVSISSGIQERECPSFTRTFYSSKDVTCQDKTDSFDAIPLKECVGPFGDPRPW
eukprot:CAMPEP_0178566516 /NCGR_PEP_ID=MMETSP0697-20121206/14797_1 /TAXON_ID=265572 /ORGANISM="Extubocellulus spinifer, Strain CCMP396" /LENGTH=159 /DNA_ID=CAMNT_0020200315 /DNA_START=321 /DNA_END=797 /DNA_ORIENTATION=-